MNNCSQFVGPALENALGEFTIRDDGTGCEVVTPFQHPDGDRITLWIEHDRGDFYTIRDYGETFAYLKLSGVDPGSESRQDRIANIHRQFDLESSVGELRLRANEEEIGPRFFDAIQAIVSVSHLIYTHKKQTPSRFKDTVGDYFDAVGYSYQTNVRKQGNSDIRRFDFGINHRSPQVLLDTIHTNDPYDLKSKADAVLLKWYEIHERDYEHGVIIDNVDGIYKEDAVSQLEQNLDYVFQWKYREAITQDIPIKA